jgi:hypothetical protein
MTIRFSIHFIMINRRSVQEIRACLKEVEKLTDMVSEVYSEMHRHTVDI